MFTDNTVARGPKPTPQDTKDCTLDGCLHSHTATTNETDFHAARFGPGRLARVATSASTDSDAKGEVYEPWYATYAMLSRTMEHELDQHMLFTADKILMHKHIARSESFPGEQL